MKNPSQLRATLLVTVTTALYAAGALATHAVIMLEWGGWIPLIALPVAVIVFAAMLPILYALQQPEIVARASALLVRGANLSLFPLIALMDGVMRFFSRMLGTRQNEQVTEEDIMTAITVAEEQGVIAEDEKKMLHGVIEFGDKAVREVMVPRADMVCVEASATLSDALQLLMQEKHSRMPVIKGGADRVIGIVYLKDLLPYVRQERMDRPVQQVMRPPYFIPAHTKVSDLLAEFQSHQRLMAIVLGERSQTVGLVTIEDLLEEIVGDILDEYDVEN
jgi:CBS domain containing-hemolysin-like protein